MIRKIVYLVLALMGASFGNANIDLVVQRSTVSFNERYNIQAGYCFKLKKPEWVYYESGAMLSVPFKTTQLRTVNSWNAEQEFTESLFGFYGGAFFYFAPIFRPGVQVGTTIEKRVVYRGENTADVPVIEQDYSVHPYIGIAAHVGLLSVTYSTHGYGLGMNIWFK